MHILGDSWKGGYLDAHCGRGQVRVAPFLWRVLGAVDDAYVVHRRDPRIILNYLREVGARAVLRKVASRSGERLRNQKYASCGLGTVVESPSRDFRPGEPVAFLAPFHPRCAE